MSTTMLIHCHNDEKMTKGENDKGRNNNDNEEIDNTDGEIDDLAEDDV